MCLSSVYKTKAGKDELICENIQHFQFDEAQQSYIFTDLFGIKTIVKGQITQVDFVKNNIKMNGGEAS